MHSQTSLVANAIAAAEMFLDDPRDVRLSWLPMSHALARTGDLYTAMVRGGCLNVVRERTSVLEACRTLPPTVILGVPAFFERLERGAVSGRIPDLQKGLGGAVRVCVSGGAPLRLRTAEFFKRRGVPLVEGSDGEGGDAESDGGDDDADSGDDDDDDSGGGQVSRAN